MSLAVRPFDFATEFADDGGRPLSFADLQLQVALLREEAAAAFVRGRAEGMAEALGTLRAERDTALLGASQALATALAALTFRFAEAERAVARLGAEIALDIGDRLAARPLERDPEAAIAAMIERALQEVRRGEPLRLRVAPALVEAVEAMIADKEEQRHEILHVTVIPDATLANGDARLEWETGALLLDRDARRATIERDLAAFLAA